MPHWRPSSQRMGAASSAPSGGREGNVDIHGETRTSDTHVGEPLTMKAPGRADRPVSGIRPTLTGTAWNEASSPGPRLGAVHKQIRPPLRLVQFTGPSEASQFERWLFAALSSVDAALLRSNFVAPKKGRPKEAKNDLPTSQVWTRSAQPNSILVTTVTAQPWLCGEDGASRRPAGITPTPEDAMSHFSNSRPHRRYDIELPYHVSGFLVGIGIRKFKEAGVWDKFPRSLKDKARAARGSWVGLKITQRDLDSIPDDAWEKTAKVLGVKWSYATASSGSRRDLIPFSVQREPTVDSAPAT
jgi:hypothetical protein